MTNNSISNRRYADDIENETNLLDNRHGMRRQRERDGKMEMLT
jgi:hypothetical protein